MGGSRRGRYMNQGLEPIGQGLSGWLKRLGMPDIDTFFAIAAAWPGAVEDPWKSGAEPAMLDKGELTVRVHNRASIRVLSYGVNDLIDRLNEAIDQPAIESIRLVGPSSGESRA